MTHLQQITALIKKFNLHPDDVFVHHIHKYKIIRRRGYKKIQASLHITITFRLAAADKDFAVVIASGSILTQAGEAFGGAISSPIRETFGEASPRNSGFEYPVSVAQKRAEGRIILELSGLYEEGYLTEDEIDEQAQADRLAKKRATTAQDSIDKTIEAMEKA